MEHITLESETGLRVVLSAQGAGIVGVYTPDRKGRFANICLPPQSGHQDPSFAGVTIAPVAGRVRDGQVCVGGTIYQMPRNDGKNCLHSGPETLGWRRWKGKRKGPEEAVFTASLRDGECGLPGNRDFSAEYRVEGNTLKITLTAQSDADTYVNMTNHAYWDLSGKWTGEAMDQEIFIAAETVWYNDPTHLPVELRGTADSVFDFRRPRTMREAMGETRGAGQMGNAQGYNNAFVLTGKSPALALYDPASGRTMTMETSAPGLVFYSGGYLVRPGMALAFEPQLLPDPTGAPILKQGRVYRMVTEFWFGTK